MESVSRYMPHRVEMPRTFMCNRGAGRVTMPEGSRNSCSMVFSSLWSRSSGDSLAYSCIVQLLEADGSGSGMDIVSGLVMASSMRWIRIFMSLRQALPASFRNAACVSGIMASTCRMSSTAFAVTGIPTRYNIPCRISCTPTNCMSVSSSEPFTHGTGSENPPRIWEA